jgi:hypothetical protein
MKKVFLFSLIFLMSFSLSNAQWSIDSFENNPVCTAVGDQDFPQIVNDGSGGTIITWRDYRNGSLPDIYAQRINSSGEAEWTSDGVPVCTAAGNQSANKIINDGVGGSIITWVDHRNGSPSDIYAQKINSLGEIQWISNGVPVCTAVDNQFGCQIVNDGSGGAIITWYDRRNGIDYDVYAQKINSLGEAEWTSNGVPVCTAANIQWINQIINDGSGGAIITWSDARNGTDYDMYAQRINSSGLVQWTNNGVPLCIATGNQSDPQLVSDGSGGAIISWQDIRGNDWDIYAQRISSSGLVQWTNGGVPVCTVAGHQFDLQLVNDGSGGVIITWNDDRNGGNNPDIFAQRISSFGESQWTNNGIPVYIAAGLSSLLEIASDVLGDVPSLPQIVSDGLGGAIITWYDYRNGNNNANIYAQKINSSGEIQWTNNGIPVCTAVDYQFDPQIVSDGSGGAIITWYDNRNGSNRDIYVQKIDVFGYLGIANPVLSSVSDINGDQGGVVSINWNASDYDMFQKKVVTYYSVWRGIEEDNGTALGKEIKPGEMSLDFSGKVYRIVNGLNGTTLWEWLGNIPAHYLTNYSYTANTFSDSTSSGNNYFKFFVSAQTENPFVFWDSNIDSGYSVDNLLPLRPQNLVATLLADRNIELSWSKNEVDPDVKNYQVHRSEIEGFTPNENTLLSDVNDTVFVDTDVPSNISSVYYKITTIDIHGNVSLPSDEASIVLVGVEEDKELPVEYAISQNYPNPFNPNTTIKYSIPRSSFVIVKIHDMLGNEIETLVKEEKQAGIYKLTWNAANLPSGVYFYRIQAGSFIETRKMILLR